MSILQDFDIYTLADKTMYSIRGGKIVKAHTFEEDPFILLDFNVYPESNEIFKIDNHGVKFFLWPKRPLASILSPVVPDPTPSTNSPLNPPQPTQPSPIPIHGNVTGRSVPGSHQNHRKYKIPTHYKPEHTRLRKPK